MTCDKTASRERDAKLMFLVTYNTIYLSASSFL